MRTRNVPPPSPSSCTGKSAANPVQGEPSGEALTSKPADAPPLAPGLYVVATPIGNLRDITLRALDVLKAADVIACEDTRVSGQLFHRFGLKLRLVSYHEHNADRMRPRLLEHLNGGESVALISDAGSPLLSDPGYRLVNDVIAAGHSVIPIPGPSAVTTALMAAGIATDRVLFAGFLPSREGARQRAIAELAAVPATLVLFESARRLAATLADLSSGLGPQRPVAVCRELTKLFEEIRRGPLSEVAQHYADAGPPKGEVTLVIGRAPEAEAPTDDEAVDRLLNEALLTQSTSEAARTVARLTGRARQGLYARALELGRDRP